MTGRLSYDAVGATRPDESIWGDRPTGFRCYERTVRIGHGPATWDTVTDELLDWAVKTRSGFRVRAASGDSARVLAGSDYVLTAALGPVAVHEPVRVVAVVDEPDRVGFAYGTLEGHPVSGEEAFVVHRAPDGTVWLTLRSLTRPAPAGPWRLGFPITLVAQRWYRRRYRRALLRSG